MKKIISSLVAMLLVLSCTFSAFAAQATDVRAKMDTAVKYSFDDYYEENGFEAYDAAAYLKYLKTGSKNALKYGDAFASSVDYAIEEGISDICNLAVFIQAFDILGKDTTDLSTIFKAAKPNKEDNPFSYFYAVETAKSLGDDALAKEICDFMIENYYILGEGTDFWGGWGTSADDLSAFILALAYYQNDYAKYVNDAVTILETFNSETGYGYGGAGNADSTAYALAAYSAILNKDMADKAYDKLVKFYNAETGGFNGEWDELLSTRNAIFGLQYYLPIADVEAPEEEATTKPPVTEEKEETTTKPAEDKREDTSKKSPATGVNAMGAAVALGALSIAVLAAKKRK